MKSVAFFTNKGGVGKTTLLCNLAAYLSVYKNKKILVVDADPQTNATQYMFDDDVLDEIYTKKNAFTVYSIAKPLSQGKGFTESYDFRSSPHFKVDVLLGDPRFSLIEDVLASDWNSGGVRGLRTTFMFRHFLQNCTDYDYVFFDMGPSLGSINRAVLIGCDFFLIPISIDIFSLRASENISSWLGEWKKRLVHSIEMLSNPEDLEVNGSEWRLRLLGYVSQQYIAKRDASGERRAVKAFERIKADIPSAIRESIISQHQKEPKDINYELGSIHNLHSLIPMSQLHRKPIFSLKTVDGIVGSHFARVEETNALYKSIADRFEQNIKAFS